VDAGDARSAAAVPAISAIAPATQGQGFPDGTVEPGTLTETKDAVLGGDRCRVRRA